MRIDNKHANNPNYFDVLIIGAGPAGLTAAIYCKRANLKVAYFEKETPGGKVVKTAVVENYPGYESISGPDLALEFFKQANNLQIKFIFGEVVNIAKIQKIFHVTTKDGTVRYAAAVIIATGMSEKKLGISGEDEYYGRGVSYCAICDAALYKNDVVATIGGGNSALEETLYLAGVVKQVYLVHRRDEFRGDASLAERVKNTPNVTLLLSYIPVAFLGDGKKITKMVVKNLKTDTTQEIAVACIFPYIGFLPNNQIVNQLQITNTTSGFITVNSKLESTVPGLFCAGDVVDKEIRQITTAVGDGAIAAVHVKKYLDMLDLN